MKYHINLHSPNRPPLCDELNSKILMKAIDNGLVYWEMEDAKIRGKQLAKKIKELYDLEEIGKQVKEKSSGYVLYSLMSVKYVNLPKHKVKTIIDRGLFYPSEEAANRIFQRAISEFKK